MRTSRRTQAARPTLKRLNLGYGNAMSEMACTRINTRGFFLQGEAEVGVGKDGCVGG